MLAIHIILNTVQLYYQRRYLDSFISVEIIEQYQAIDL